MVHDGTEVASGHARGLSTPDTRQTRIEAQLHRKRIKHRETKRASPSKWRCMRVKNMVELGVQMPMVCEA